jgi:hypothetical protein
MVTTRKSLLLGALTLFPATSAGAQDPFEIQVYEYATVPKARWNLETHVNYTVRGTRVMDGATAPSEGQTHLTFELTRGITDLFEMAGYVVLAKRSGHGPDFVAFRLRPRVRAPDAWKLPVKLSLSLEAGFPRDLYEAADVTLEVRPIIERRFGRVQLDLNPVLGRSIRGPGSGEGWDFEPGARIGLEVSKVVELSAEYYGSLGQVGNFLPRAQQVHQFFGGGDLQVSENIVINAGVGFGATDAGNRTVLKARIGWMF